MLCSDLSTARQPEISDPHSVCRLNHRFARDGLQGGREACQLLQQGRPAGELRGAAGGARTCASCNVVGGRAWALLMDAEALSVCGEELGELRHYGAGLRGTAALPTGCMLLRL